MGKEFSFAKFINTADILGVVTLGLALTYGSADFMLLSLVLCMAIAIYMLAAQLLSVRVRVHSAVALTAIRPWYNNAVLIVWEAASIALMMVVAANVPELSRAALTAASISLASVGILSVDAVRFIRGWYDDEWRQILHDDFDVPRDYL